MRVLVTGSTGLLGNAVVRELYSNEDEVVCLVRKTPDGPVFRDVSVRFALGEMLDSEFVSSCIRDCDAVVHAAGLIHLGWTRVDESMRVNRDGTRSIVDACVRHQVPLAHVGTVDTIAVGKRSQFANEETDLDNAGGQVPSAYVVSKRAGLEEVIKGVSRGLRAVILHPGLMFGPWDWKPSSGRMIIELARAWRPIAPSGGGSICDNRDVASGILNGIRKLIDGEIESGRQYILAGENWTYFELWKQIARRTRQRRPIMPAGPAQRWIGRVLGDLMTRLTGEESDLNSAVIQMSSQFHWYDCKRAKVELGYRYRDPGESLDDAIAWFQQQQMLPSNV